MQNINIKHGIKNFLLKVKKNIGFKISFTLFYLLLIIVFYHFKVPCFILTIFKIPCPGCGITRAGLSFLRFDFISAFKYHLMFWSVPILYLYFLTDGSLFDNRKVNNAVFSVIAAGFILNWAVKIVYFLL